MTNIHPTLNIKIAADRIYIIMTECYSRNKNCKHILRADICRIFNEQEDSLCKKDEIPFCLSEKAFWRIVEYDPRLSRSPIDTDCAIIRTYWENRTNNEKRKGAIENCQENGSKHSDNSVAKRTGQNPQVITKQDTKPRFKMPITNMTISEEVKKLLGIKDVEFAENPVHETESQKSTTYDSGLKGENSPQQNTHNQDKVAGIDNASRSTINNGQESVSEIDSNHKLNATHEDGSKGASAENISKVKCSKCACETQFRASSVHNRTQWRIRGTNRTAVYMVCCSECGQSYYAIDGNVTNLVSGKDLVELYGSQCLTSR